MTLLLFGLGASSQSQTANGIYPPSWWCDSQIDTVEVLFYNQHISDNQLVTIKPMGVKIVDVHLPENPHYVFVKVALPEELSQDGLVSFSLGRKTLGVFNVHAKTPASQNSFEGVTASDMMYLIMPDRFANGNPSNDVVPNTLEPTHDRSIPLARHGGDLQGILQHTDYLKRLGVTAVWLNPFLENNQKVESYHGYAFTNHYRVDPRLGSLKDMKELANRFRENKIKLVMDVVYNHIGDQHFLAKDPPEAGWFHVSDTFYRTNYRATVLLDPYASKSDLKKLSDGAFDYTMPDLDQSNPRVARYLKQYTVWWIRTLGLNGLRIDTYAYSDQNFMRDLVQTVYNDILPLDSTFHIFAETWVHGHAVQAHFSNHFGNSPRPLYLTDFQWYFAVKKALSNNFGWTDGLSALYYALAKDTDYPDPKGHVTFLDNHDLDRFFGVINQDTSKWKMGIGLLMTGRGIPCLLYGTELLMPEGGNHGVLRKDMPGGWKGDTSTVFETNGLNRAQASAISYIKTLADIRSTGIFTGKLTQFVPENGVYVYAWEHKGKTLICMVNQQEAPALVRTERYAELLQGKTELTSALESDITHLTTSEKWWEISPMSFHAWWVN